MAGRTGRDSLGGVLEQLRRLGLAPATIFDVGVDTGTPDLYAAFPEAHFVLVEPNADRLPELERIAARLARADYVLAAATAEPGAVRLNVHADPAGSSLLNETEGAQADGAAREVAGLTLDSIAGDKHCTGPHLVKLDTQGNELEVLRGAGAVLGETEVVIAETSLFRFFKGGPEFGDVVSFMAERGFVVYDLFGAHYRPLDGALAQVDLVFVRENGRFRESHVFATPEQRAASTAYHRKGPAGRALARLRHRLWEILRS